MLANDLGHATSVSGYQDMRKCTGNNLREWDPDALFTVTCHEDGHPGEFFKDEIAGIATRAKTPFTTIAGNMAAVNGAHPHRSIQEIYARGLQGPISR